MFINIFVYNSLIIFFTKTIQLIYIYIRLGISINNVEMNQQKKKKNFFDIYIYIIFF